MRSLAALLLLAACSPPSVTPVVDSGTPDSGAPDSGTQGPPPDAGTPCDGTRDCRIRWTTAPDFPANVDHHSSFVAQKFLYVAGGVNNVSPFQVYDTVRRAPIAADGSLGAWVDCSKLPIPLGFHAMAQTATHVYLLLGVSEDAQGLLASDYVLVGALQPDGDITWTSSPKRLGHAGLHSTASIIGDTLFVAGGTGRGNAPQSIVKHAKLNADGSLGDWVDAPALPLQRSHHVAFVRDGQLFLAGGFDTAQVPIADVLRSQLDANGVLTGWVVAGEIDSSPWTSAAFVYRDHVFLLGGGEGGPGNQHYVNRVRRARFTESMTLLPFEDVDTLPAARAHVHQTPIFEDHVYSVGGRQEDNFSSISKVFVGVIGDRSK
jgi:hypothetical protein